MQFLTSLDVRNGLPELKISGNPRRGNPPAPAEGRTRRPEGQYDGLTKREEGREGIGEGRFGIGDGLRRERRRHRHLRRYRRRRRRCLRRREKGASESVSRLGDNIYS